MRKREVSPQEILTCYLQTMEHLPHIADRLKDSRPVILNLEELDPRERQHALDFISGVVYALDGAYEEAGENVFLFVPGTVSLVDEEGEAR